MLKTKSLRSIRSLSDDLLNREESCMRAPRPTAVFEDLLPNVIKQICSHFNVFVKKSIIKDPLNNQKATITSRRSTNIGSLVKQVNPKHMENIILLDALYDDDNELVEIQVCKQQKIPDKLIQAIVTVAPFYKTLRKITIRECRMDSSTTSELSRLINVIALTEICLDSSFVRNANYAILLEIPSCLNHLSLCSCRINDIVCESIVSKLHYQTVAEKQLLTLHLSRNCITDKGAESISTMLRSNRHLRYLNLAGNQISDDGACVILEVLRDFPLTSDENSAKRQRILKYVKRKNKLLSKFYNECKFELERGQSSEETKTFFRKLKGRIHSINIENVNPNVPINKEEQLKQANALATQLIGQYQDPFGIDRTVLKDGWAYCKGNFTLCYLNLAYNGLSYLSVKRVLEILLYQQDIGKLMEPGLLKIVLEGNPIPVSCPQYTQISEIINSSHSDWISVTKRKTSKSQ